jgi:arginase family enzyme
MNSIEPSGLTAREAIDAVRPTCENGLIGFDVADVAPEHGSASQVTSVLAARLLAEAFATMAAPTAGCERNWKWQQSA